MVRLSSPGPACPIQTETQTTERATAPGVKRCGGGELCLALSTVWAHSTFAPCLHYL